MRMGHGVCKEKSRTGFDQPGEEKVGVGVGRGVCPAAVFSHRKVGAREGRARLLAAQA